MLKAFNDTLERHILIEYPYTDNDMHTLELELSREYKSYNIDFMQIYTLNKKTVNLLYNELYVKKKNIRLTSHTKKLHRYLKKLGFKSKFVSLVKNDVVHASLVEVVILGGSADSSSKVLEIVKHINIQNLTLVIVQHVKQTKKGFFDNVLKKYTKHIVKYATNNEKLEKGVVYLAPENKHLKIDNGIFKLTSEEKYNFSRPSISISYESFSGYYKEKLLVIQECGYASDGVDKINFLKKNNSLLIIQDPVECKAKPMVESALEIALHDYVFNVDAIIRYINYLNKNTTKEVWIEYLLYSVYKVYSYDLRMYHRDTVSRRLDIFMINHDIKNIKDAVGIILYNSTAFKGFFLELSINVTEFFRNPLSLNFLIEALHQIYKKSHHVKIWSAGCSSGEEVYSITILLKSLGYCEKSIIYATDFNNVILSEAKNAIYSKGTMNLAKSNLAKIDLDINFDDYVSENNNYFSIDKKINKKILFFQHNLASDASFNEFEIIICKNVIIYFDDLLQKKVCQLFYDSLKLGGFLVLGDSEYLVDDLVDKFERYNENCKIFKKVA